MNGLFLINFFVSSLRGLWWFFDFRSQGCSQRLYPGLATCTPQGVLKEMNKMKTTELQGCRQGLYPGLVTCTPQGVLKEMNKMKTPELQGCRQGLYPGLVTCTPQGVLKEMNKIKIKDGSMLQGLAPCVRCGIFKKNNKMKTPEGSMLQAQGKQSVTLGNVIIKTSKAPAGRYILPFLCLITFSFVAANDQTSNQKFINSFVKHYEFNPEGRYTHEYHPFLLEKTAESFDLLEQELGQKGFDLSGRVVIFGYEENAVSSYYTNFRKPKINDEAISKNNIGWSPKLHNRFGIITGFLFKDFNQACARKVGLPEPIFEHINPESILVFDDRASIFQEHAFGQIFDLMLQAHDSITRSYDKPDIVCVLEKVAKFWQMLYSSELKIGNKQVDGTQDILFSIEYLKHLLRSPLPFIKFFTGPDITYPIEISCKQEKGATLNAQAFAKTLITKLQPIDNKATVYIFGSFVDGVGKSTMLGNIKNWMKHGDDCDSFEHVDNTSSQLFELFKFKDDVYIADLPAQISHFSYKPDGIVFVDAKTELTEQQSKEVALYVQEHAASLTEQYDNALHNVQKIIGEKGYFTAELNEVTSNTSWFLKNLFLLGKEKDNRWIPFKHQDRDYLFHADQPWDIRILQPLNKVKSEGLKNVAAEQMFFSSGIRFPLVYREFLSKLVKGLKDQKIEKVVFVDFLSMYPRSSRENIRINYLQQQMALLNKGFEVKYSLYRDFVGGGGELLHCLLNRQSRKKFTSALELEALVRLTLSNVIDDARYADNLQGIGLKKLTEMLDEYLQHIPGEDTELIHDFVTKKLSLETEKLEQSYGLSKSFINVQQFKPSAALAFSELLQLFFTEHLMQEKINDLWQNCGDILFEQNDHKHEQGALTDVVFKTQSGRSVRALYAFSQDCKNEFVLTPILRLLRAQWYMVLCNLLYAEKTGKQLYQLEKDQYWLPPLWLKKGPDGLIYLVQPMLFGELDKEKKVSQQVKNIFFHFNVDTQRGRFGVLDEKPYLLDWDVKGTQRGIYAFDCDLEKAKKGSYTASVVSLWVNRHQVEHGQMVLPTSDLYEKLKESVVWKSEFNTLVRSTMKKGEFQQRGAGILGGQRNTYRGGKKHRSVAKMFIRLLITLDMVVKDPDADIVVRDGNRQDFRAALKLFEKVTLPRYFGMIYPENLFKNYDDVEPYPSWSFWDSIDD